MKSIKTLLIVVVILLSADITLAQGLSFSPMVEFPVGGTTPESMATGDFNHDGQLDIAVANPNSDTMSILLGDGNGSFTITDFPKPGAPFSLAVGDFDEDGNLDLLVANARYNFRSFSILYGLGDGSFGTPADIPLPRVANAVGAADFNGDGHLDIAVADDVDTVYVLLGDGTGSYEWQSTSIVGAGPRSIVTGDINHDGHLDMAVANENSGDISVLFGDGTGSFSDATQITTGAAPESVAVVDLNQDGNLDLAVGNEDGETVSILLGDGTGSFSTITQFSAPTPSAIVVSDLNLDGYPDIAATNAGLSTVSVLLGDGAGSFTAPVSFAVGNEPRPIVVGDFNNDGKPDLAAGNENGNSVSLLLNTSSTQNTATGTNINVQPVDATTATTPVNLVFSQVDQAGTTSLTTSTSGPAPPSGFQVGNPATYYELTTTAVFTGPISVCINYAGVSFQDESQLRLFHFESDVWVDRTVSIDTVNKIVCGSVNSLSPFALFERSAIAVTIDIKPGSYPNAINLGSGGTVAVAIFSTATFDATGINPTTVTLANAPVKLKGKGTVMASFEDVNHDGRLDLLVHVVTDALQLSETDVSAVVQGTTYSGALIRGADSVRIVP